MKSNQQLPNSKHFQLEQIADGVYAAIRIEGGAAIGNAGIVDLGDRTLIFDTFMAPQAAQDLRTAAETLTGRPVDFVIDSHWLNDHIWGNQVFDESTEIIATEETRRVFIATRRHGAFDSFMADAEKNLEATRAQFEVAEDEGQRRQLALWIDYHQSVVETKPILQIRVPNLTFSQSLTFHGTERTAKVIDFVGGHKESDAVLFLPQEGIIFMSDLLFIGYQPYLGGGDPDSVLHSLKAVSELAPKLLVPGHGPVGTAESLKVMGQYILSVDELARKMVEYGETEETIEATAIPEAYDDWLFDAFFPVNLQFLYQRYLHERESAGTGVGLGVS